ncbi:hypothetical protein Nham_1144 [Nitrobacter hamburgensis X14]|uniref:Uncharacterized protein n=1 Tax=Nitrobacter hamburgensis (strain DSM 10229 / NCIMB 13809 / X14) TaxID=323097 RepID=Q1QP57_NITHX|nr:hypothetical protein Nham_1144 [Nitrobacter hamburgensis X14]
MSAALRFGGLRLSIPKSTPSPQNRSFVSRQAWQITKAGRTTQAQLQSGEAIEASKEQPSSCQNKYPSVHNDHSLTSSPGPVSRAGICATPGSRPLFRAKWNPARNGNFWTRDRGR